MVQKVLRYVEQYQMLEPQDAVVAGVSGGADSVCLLFLLKKIQSYIPFRLFVLHVNHGIRAEAGEDEDYVRRLCEKWQIPFFAVRENVAALAKEQGISEEEAGRNLRYASLEQILKQEAFPEWQQGKAKIAVAHNQNDRAETMLFNLFRGTGIQGLCSIPPVRGRIIRPLLCLERKEIEAILKEEQLSYCIDRTNAEDTYTRNKIRNHIFPYIEEEISPAAIEKMNQAADLISGANDYIRGEVKTAWERVEVPMTSRNAREKCVSGEDEDCFEKVSAPGFDSDVVILHVEALLQEPSFLQSQLLLYALEKIVPGRKDVASVHVQAIRKLCRTQGSKSLNLPYGIRVRKEYEYLTIENDYNVPSDLSAPISVTQIPGIYSLGDFGELEFSVLECEKDVRIPEKKYTKWFDYDKIEKSLVVRKRKSGDYLTINDSLSHKSLKEYLIGEKIPKFQRDDLWILAEENHVLWVIGHRISTKYKINENTKRILQVQLRGGTSWQNM